MATIQGQNIELVDRLTSFEDTTKTALNIGKSSESNASSDSASTTPKPKPKSSKNRRHKHVRK